LLGSFKFSDKPALRLGMLLATLAEAVDQNNQDYRESH